MQAARGERPRWGGAERAALQVAVAREHLLRIALDWPRLLAQAAPPTPLSGCPLWDAAQPPPQQQQALGGWLQQRWLQRPCAGLLAALEREPVAAALAWAGRTGTPPARLLAATLPRAAQLRTPCRPLGQQLTLPPAAVPDTGAWTRRQARSPAPADNAGMRLIARLSELLRLAGPGGADWLQAEAVDLGDGVGYASVEVGRGRLSYRVEIGRDERVRRLQVLTPTDWNAHPAGVLAEALAVLPPDASGAADARLLAAAFDPCEPFEVLLPEPAPCMS